MRLRTASFGNRVFFFFGQGFYATCFYATYVQSQVTVIVTVRDFYSCSFGELKRITHPLINFSCRSRCLYARLSYA